MNYNIPIYYNNDIFIIRTLKVIYILINSMYRTAIMSNVTPIMNDVHIKILLLYYIDRTFKNSSVVYTCCALFCLYTERFTFIATNLTLNFGKSCLYMRFMSSVIHEVPNTQYYMFIIYLFISFYRKVRHYCK